MSAPEQFSGMAFKHRMISALRKAGIPEQENFYLLKNSALVLLVINHKLNLYETKNIKNRDVRKLKADANPSLPKKSLSFYESDDWKRVRYQALVKHGAACQCCGATRSDGVKLHVDHIKPRSKYPELELKLDNLQILCEPCNMGKSARDETDWRDTTA